MSLAQIHRLIAVRNKQNKQGIEFKSEEEAGVKSIIVLWIANGDVA
jgi:hypothetical protein